MDEALEDQSRLSESQHQKTPEEVEQHDAPQEQSLRVGMNATDEINLSEKPAVDLDAHGPASHSQDGQRAEEKGSLENMNDMNDEKNDTDSSNGTTTYDKKPEPTEEGRRTEGSSVDQKPPETLKLLQRKKELNKKVALFSKEIRSLRQELEDKEEEILALREERAEREARFQEVQAEALELLKKNAIDAMPDNEVADEFTRIFATCRRWAKKYSRPLPVAQGDIDEEIRVILRPGKDDNSASVKGLQAVAEGRLSTRHVLTATLAGVLARQLFARPFFYLRCCEHQGQQVRMEQVLLNVEDMGATAGQKTQHHWRAMTVRMLNSSKTGISTETGSNGQYDVQRLKKAAYERLGDYILEMNKMVLKQLDAQEIKSRRTELMALFTRAGEFACRLHGQRVLIKVLSSPQGIGNFSVDSELVEAHTIVDIEQNNHDWDGNPIDLVIQPAIIAYGNERGENYDKSKVWSKAIVWMEKQDFKARSTGAKSRKTRSSDASQSCIRARNSDEPIMIDDDDDSRSRVQVSNDTDNGSQGTAPRNQPKRGNAVKQQATTMSSQPLKVSDDVVVPPPKKMSRRKRRKLNAQPAVQAANTPMISREGIDTSPEQAESEPRAHNREQAGAIVAASSEQTKTADDEPEFLKKRSRGSEALSEQESSCKRRATERQVEKDVIDSPGIGQSRRGRLVAEDGTYHR